MNGHSSMIGSIGP